MEMSVLMRETATKFSEVKQIRLPYSASSPLDGSFPPEEIVTIRKGRNGLVCIHLEMEMGFESPYC